MDDRRRAWSARAAPPSAPRHFLDRPTSNHADVHAAGNQSSLQQNSRRSNKPIRLNEGGRPAPEQIFHEVRTTYVPPSAVERLENGHDEFAEQPQGVSTSATFHSPTLHTNSTAQKRFHAGYSTSEKTTYQGLPNGKDISGFAADQQPSPFKFKSAARIRLELVHNGSPTKKPQDASQYSRPSIPAFQQRRQRLARILPVQVRRFFKRRKSEDNLAFDPFNSAASHSTSVVGRVFLCAVIALLLYLGWRFALRDSTANGRPRPIIPNKELVDSPSEPLSTPRRWGLRQPAVNYASESQIPLAPSRRPTFYSRPYHTLQELRSLPSRFDSDRVNAAAGGLSIPAISVVVDCIAGDSGREEEKASALKSLVASLSSDHVKIENVHILATSQLSSYLNREDIGDTGAIVINAEADSNSYVAAVDSVIRPFADGTNHLLLLACPTGFIDEDAGTGSTGQFLQDMLRAAGTEAYSDKALTTSGIAQAHSSRRGSHYIGYQSSTLPVSTGNNQAHTVRHLTEARRVDLASQSLLLPAYLAKAIFETVEEHDQNAIFGAQEGFISMISRQLALRSGVESWALPIALPVAYEHSMVMQELTKLAELASQQLGDTDTAEDSFDGSGANVSIFLDSVDGGNIAAWTTLVCGFTAARNYDHALRVYSPSITEPQAGVFADCPDVSVLPYHPVPEKAWRPDLCLSAREASVEQEGAESCTVIRLPLAELHSLDWISALPLESLQNWHVPKIDVVVIANNRPGSLYRLLQSVRNAYFLGDKVNLHVNLEQTADHETRRLFDGAKWPFGELFMRHRVLLGGLLTSIVESWYPADNDTHGVLLEDDVEVSPLFYSWLKFTILYYRYGTATARARSQRQFGVSLYQPKNIELRPEGRRSFDAHELFADLGIPRTSPYLSQIPCSWGAVYFPEHWREFHQFLSIRLSETAMELSDAIVPEIRSNKWPNSWKRYMIELAYLRGYTMLYPNYENFGSLSTNHLELGTHVKDESIAQKRKDIFNVPLLRETDSLTTGLPDGRLPDWTSLPVVDLWGSIATEKEIINRGIYTSNELDLCNRAIEVTKAATEKTDLDSPSILSFDASDLLCRSEAQDGDWTEWRTRMRWSPSDIDVKMLMDREAQLEERERKLVDREARLLQQAE